MDAARVHYDRLVGDQLMYFEKKKDAETNQPPKKITSMR